MKPVKFTFSLLMLLALMSFGCASVEPSANSSAYEPPELMREQPAKNSDQQNCGGWAILYAMLEIGGSCLAGR
jgi:hypothetical protein